MAENNGNKPAAADNRYKNYDLTNLDNYERDYELSGGSKVGQIYEIPEIKDMAGILARGIIKNERQLNAILRLSYRHKKFKDDNHQELLRQKIIGTAAIGGVRSLDALFAANGLLAPDMYRVARGMPKYKGRGEREREEPVYRGSDFREQEKPTQNNGVISH